MWENRIKLEKFIYHENARKKIKNKLNKLKIDDNCITDLHISTDGGYVIYKVILSNKNEFIVFDDGSEIK